MGGVGDMREAREVSMGTQKKATACEATSATTKQKATAAAAAAAGGVSVA